MLNLVSKTRFFITILDTMELIRINKLISQSGIASRREAEELIKKGKVLVNGKKAQLGQRVSWQDKIIINNQKVEKKQELKYYLLNKPKKTICTLKDNFNRTRVVDLIEDDSYLFPVGRLDYDTTGVLLITNDGDLSNKLTHPSSEIEREYRARLNKKLSFEELNFLNKNSVIINGKISKQTVAQVGPKSYLVTIKEGSYHHVKKIFECVEKEVLDLKRISFASLTCEKMMIGEYRKLKSFEIKYLKSLVK